MKILFLSFYYPPDLSAGSFRAVALVNELKKLSDDIQITVFTTQPNRYKDLSDKVSSLEQADNIQIHRENLPAHKSGVVSQVIAFTKYAYKARSFSKEQEWDVVVATSSRLMTAFLGAKISRDINCPLYLDIRDLFVDTIKEVFSRYVLWFVLPLAKKIEKYTFNSADKINIVSQGFMGYIKKLVPETEISVFTNGVDEAFVNYSASHSSAEIESEPPYTVLYAGNVGEGQGLHNVLPDAVKILSSDVKFRIVGSGGRINQLRNVAAHSEDIENTNNIEIVPPIPRQQLLAEYKNADVLFVHLNDYSAFKKVLPSKLFEYGATGKPIVAGVAGYAAEFVESELDGAIVFKPGDSKGLATAIQETVLNLEAVDRTAFCEKYSRTKIMKTMARDIVTLANKENDRAD